MGRSNFTPKLIVGLGNPGKQYQNTWHNIGFLFIDKFRESIDNPFAIINKKEYEVTKIPHFHLTMLKPLTFMNNSGKVLADFLKYNKFKENEILIVHDDLDIGFGKYKLQRGKFPKVHNGLTSIHEQTGKENFWYLRLGVETRNDKKIAGTDYVLSKIEKNDTLDQVLKETIQEVLVSLNEK